MFTKPSVLAVPGLAAQMRLHLAFFVCTSALLLASMGARATQGSAPSSVPSQWQSTVAMESMTLEDATRQRKLEVAFWFPAAAGATVKTLSPRLPLRGFEVAQAKAHHGQERMPLVVISHGNWGTQFSLSWLALGLVRQGHVVVSMQHPGTSADDRSLAGAVRLWERATDVSKVLDEALRNPRWASWIDPQRIGFAGHSFGGWTGVALAGGQYDPLVQRAACAKAPAQDLYCKTSSELDASSVPIDDANKSFADARFKAYYIMASGPAQGFTEASLKAIATPFLVDTAAADTILAPGPNSSLLARHLGQAQEVSRPVGHFTYAPQCKAIVGSLLTKALGVPLCEDPPGVDRAQVHQVVTREAGAFFGKALALGR